MPSLTAPSYGGIEVRHKAKLACGRLKVQKSSEMTAAPGEKTEQCEEGHYTRWAGRLFGNSPKDLHLGGTVR